MKKIQMVDLVSQYHNIKEEVDSAILNVLESAAFINGPEVKSFQKEMEEYLGVKHVIPCGNGTDALQIALMALGLQPGDEVITTTFTFVATAEVIALLGLTPVLVDVDPDTFTIDIEGIKSNLTDKTKAIIPVHLFGQCANMEEIMAIAKQHNIYVVEDNAQAIGANYTFSDGMKKKSGTIGDIGTTSFFPSKNLGAYGDGGALFTNNDELAEKMRMIVNHGMKVRYYHDEIGVNSRLDSVQAAVLRIKLRKLDEYSAARNKAANYYNQSFAENSKIKTPAIGTYTDHVFHQYTLVLDESIDRDKLRAQLAEQNIPAMIYYPVPLHMQKAYKSNRYGEGDFPVAEHLSKHVISLPMHTELTEDQLKYITEKVNKFTN